MKKIVFLAIVMAVALANVAKAEPTGNSGEAGVEQAINNLDAVARTCDEQLIERFLLNAIKKNPDGTKPLVSAFLENQKSSNSCGDANKVSVSKIMNDVLAKLQGEKDSEKLVAAVLDSYTPAAGSERNGNRGKPGLRNREREREPRENPNQTSAN